MKPFIERFKVGDNFTRVSVFTYNDFGEIDVKFHLDDFYDIYDLLDLGLYGVKVRNGEIDLKKALDYIENIAFNPANGAREDVTNMVYLLTNLPEEREYRKIEEQLNDLIDKEKNTLLVTNGNAYNDISNVYNLDFIDEYSRAIDSLLIFACNDAEDSESDYSTDSSEPDYSNDEDVDDYATEDKK